MFHHTKMLRNRLSTSNSLNFVRRFQVIWDLRVKWRGTFDLEQSGVRHKLFKLISSYKASISNVINRCDKQDSAPLDNIQRQKRWMRSMAVRFTRLCLPERRTAPPSSPQNEYLSTCDPSMLSPLWLVRISPVDSYQAARFKQLDLNNLPPQSSNCDRLFELIRLLLLRRATVIDALAKNSERAKNELGRLNQAVLYKQTN